MDDFSNLPKSPAEAKENNSLYYYTGKTCKNGHITKRLASNAGCIECLKERKNVFRARPENKAKEAKTKQKWYERNRDQELVRMKEWRERNKGYHLSNLKEYRKNNPEIYAAHAAKRRASVLQRTPDWLTQDHLEEIKDIYKSSPDGFHVDHIVPLQGSAVSGLHVPWNLQILPASINIQKSNNYIGV